MELFITLTLGVVLSAFWEDKDIISIFSYYLITYRDILFTFMLELSMYGALAVGLYGATSGIEKKELKTHKYLILRAVTIGVLLKSLMIGSVLWFVFHTPYAFLFAIIVSQIDPVSVAYLMKKRPSEFSETGRTILRAWSSFDDPMTVLLGLYIFLPLAITSTAIFSLSTYVSQLLINIGYAFVVYILYKYVAKTNQKSLILLGGVFVLAVFYKLVLGIALIGLFLRPKFTFLYSAVRWAFLFAAFLLGTMVEMLPTHVIYGIILGVTAFVAQILVTFLIAINLPTKDKLYIAFSQYNGITAVVLALIIAQWVPETISIIAPAILVINSIYYVCNFFLEKRHSSWMVKNYHLHL